MELRHSREINELLKQCGIPKQTMEDLDSKMKEEFSKWDLSQHYDIFKLPPYNEEMSQHASCDIVKFNRICINGNINNVYKHISKYSRSELLNVFKQIHFQQNMTCPLKTYNFQNVSKILFYHLYNSKSKFYYEYFIECLNKVEDPEEVFARF